MAELVIDSVLRKRAGDALREAGYTYRRIMRIHPPRDTTGDYADTLLEVWFVDGDGNGDWVYMEEIRRGGVLALKVARDP